MASFEDGLDAIRAKARAIEAEVLEFWEIEGMGREELERELAMLERSGQEDLATHLESAAAMAEIRNVELMLGAGTGPERSSEPGHGRPARRTSYDLTDYYKALDWLRAEELREEARECRIAMVRSRLAHLDRLDALTPRPDPGPSPLERYLAELRGEEAD